MTRDDSWLRRGQTTRDEWQSTSGVSFGEWLRRGRTPEGMDADEQSLAERIQAHIAQVQRDAERAMNRQLRRQGR